MAENGFDVGREIRLARRLPEEESGEGVSDDEAVLREGWGNLMYIPWTPTVQSRYELASSKLVSSEMLEG